MINGSGCLDGAIDEGDAMNGEVKTSRQQDGLLPLVGFTTPFAPTIFPQELLSIKFPSDFDRREKLRTET